jgi:hypothetical protein
MSRRSEGLNFRSKGPFFEINPKDATTYGVGDGKNVFISSRRGSVEVRAWVTDRVKPGTIFMPFHYAEAAANVLTNTFLDPIGKIPEYGNCGQIELKQKGSGIDPVCVSADARPSGRRVYWGHRSPPLFWKVKQIAGHRRFNDRTIIRFLFERSGITVRCAVKGLSARKAGQIVYGST